MSKRHDIVIALKERLSYIVAGFSVTLPDETYVCGSSPKSVKIWQKTPWGKHQVPAIGIWDTDQEMDEESNTESSNYWKLTVTIVGMVDGAAPADAVRVLQDDIMAVIGSDPTLDGLAVWCRIPNVKMIVDDSGSDVVAGCELTVEVHYRASLWRV